MRATKAIGLSIYLCLFGPAGWAGDAGLASAGVRTGISANSSARRFIQTETFAKWDLLHAFDLRNSTTLSLQLESSAGWLSGRGEDAFIGTLGPAARIGRADFPLAFVAGSSPTVLSRDEFGDKDFGIPFQFTSYLGLELRPWGRLDFGYRFQHMSNAGLSSHNPGLNLHMFSFGYTF